MERGGSVAGTSHAVLGWLRGGYWLAATACASSSPGGAGPVDAAVDAVAAPACAAASRCAGPISGGGECVTTLDATLVDPGGHPVAGVPVFACGTNLCTEPSPTGLEGHAHLAPCVTIENPALKVFDDPTWAPFAAGSSAPGRASRSPG
jgi:hypothetical protein